MFDFISLKEVVEKFRNEVISISSYLDSSFKYTEEEILNFELEELKKVTINPIAQSICVIEKLKERSLIDYKIRVLNFEALKEDVSKVIKPVIEIKEDKSKISYIYHENLDMIEVIYDGDRIYSEFYGV